MVELPDWLKWLLIGLALGGTNLLQYVGLAAPAREQANEIKGREGWCFEELAKTQEELRKCWKECARR